jgi:HEAT repeat protein
LLRAALDHPDAAVRSNALTALGLRGKSACSAALLLAGLVDPDATVRSAAAFAIGEVLDAPLAEANETALIGALGDREADVRLHAALALARLGSGLARPALQHAARHDVDAGVRLNAYLALATQGDVDMATDLIAGLDDRDLEVRAVCAASLRVLTGVDHGVDRASWEQWARERRDGGHR